jgi:hypothetical protein
MPRLKTRSIPESSRPRLDPAGGHGDPLEGLLAQRGPDDVPRVVPEEGAARRPRGRDRVPGGGPDADGEDPDPLARERADRPLDAPLVVLAVETARSRSIRLLP